MIYRQEDLINSIEEKNLKNFEKNGGLKMYIYKEESEKESVLKKMKEIGSKYEPQDYVAPEIKSLGLEEAEYQTPLAEDIERLAEDSLKAYKENQLEAINSKYDVKLDNLSDSASSALEKKGLSEEDILASFSKITDKTINKNIKKGLAHSSIFENALKEVQSTKQKEINEVNFEYEKKMSKLENEKDILEQQKQNALTSFDISYATKLQSKIANINSEIAKEQAKIEKYNKDIASQEAAYRKEQEKEIAAEQKKIDDHNKALQKVLDKEGMIEINKRKSQEKYYIVNDYMLSLSKDKALEELNKDSTYKKELGSFYNLLYAQTLRRED